MNELYLNNDAVSVLESCDFIIAQEDFLHINRVADFNVAIYCIQGEINVTENDIDYTVKANELLFLKHGLHHYGKQEIKKGTSWYYVHFYLEGEQKYEMFAPDVVPLMQYVKRCYSLLLPKKSNIF